jgi:hypothetical protein
MKTLSINNLKTDRNLNTDAIKSIFESLLPHLMNNHSFLEVLHLEAVQLEKQGQLAIAQHLFRTVQKEATKFTALQSWAFFKDGEILLKTGHEKKATESFNRALELNPNHTKAMLMLHPPHEPLIILFGQKTKWWHFGIHMNFYCNNLELWEYYFQHRKIDQLWIYPPLRIMDLDWSVMSKLAESYISSNGSIILALNQERQVLLSCDELQSIISAGKMHFRLEIETFVEKLLI